MASTGTVPEGRDLRRTRSESAAPAFGEPRPAHVRAHHHHRAGSSISRTAPTLPPLDLPGELRLPHVDAGAPRSRYDWETPLFEEPRRAPSPRPAADPPEQANNEQADGLVGMFLELLGWAGPNAKARRELLSLIFSLSFGFTQFVIIVTLLAYSAHRESPTAPGKTEWAACERPLGVWNALWLVRVALVCLLSFWTFKRDREARRITRARRRDDSDAEIATQRYLNGRPYHPRVDDDFARPPRRQPIRPGGISYESSAGGSRTETPNNSSQTRLHARVSLCTSFISLAWFLTAHILAYTSVNSCRFSAPHLWWLTFGILCILYLMILEIFLLGLLVFILGPVLYLVWNIILLCLGRHPLQNPHYIKPDIGKLPKAIVQQIPLVLYIPPPPGESVDSPAPVPPEAAHAYPPKPSPTATTSTSTPSTAAAPGAPKRRFAFFRPKRAAASKKKPGPSSTRKEGGPGGDGEGEDADADVPWDEMWEKGEYPFVRLEGNRAVCAICLMDFEEPRRVRGAPPPPPAPAPAEGKLGTTTGREGEREGGGAEEIQVEAVTEEERDALAAGAGEGEGGEGPQPLRLLMCGHAFHQTCVDPWLTDVSGRCPTCQRPVELPAPSKKGKRRGRGAART